jgi:hypothetical protein
MKYNITRHCLSRYIERILGGLNNSPNIFKEILNCLNSGINITSKLSETHPRFILYIKERYGNKGYTFIKKNYCIFVLTKRKNTDNLYDVLTCYNENNSLKQFENSILSKDEIYIKLKNLKRNV